MTNTKALTVFREMRELADRLRELLGDAEFEYDELSTQLAQANTVIAERDAQLAAERAMADRLAVALSYIVNASVKEMQALDMTMTEIASQTPIMLAHDAYSAYEAHKATRQPTQDKGGE